VAEAIADADECTEMDNWNWIRPQVQMDSFEEVPLVSSSGSSGIRDLHDND